MWCGLECHKPAVNSTPVSPGGLLQFEGHMLPGGHCTPMSSTDVTINGCCRSSLSNKKLKDLIGKVCQSPRIVVYADGSICIFDGLGGLKHKQPALPAGPVLCIASWHRSKRGFGAVAVISHVKTICCGFPKLSRCTLIVASLSFAEAGLESGHVYFAAIRHLEASN